MAIPLANTRSFAAQVRTEDNALQSATLRGRSVTVSKAILGIAATLTVVAIAAHIFAVVLPALFLSIPTLPFIITGVLALAAFSCILAAIALSTITRERAPMSSVDCGKDLPSASGSHEGQAPASPLASTGDVSKELVVEEGGVAAASHEGKVLAEREKDQAAAQGDAAPAAIQISPEDELRSKFEAQLRIILSQLEALKAASGAGAMPASS